MRSRTLWTVFSLMVTCGGIGHPANAVVVMGTPTMMAFPPNGGVRDYSPSMSSDDLELYFGSTRDPSGNWDTWVSRRDSPSDAFGTPEFVTHLNHPSVSSDGLSLYGNAGGEYGFNDLFVLTRSSTAAPWGEPVNLGSTVNSSLDEVECDISADGLELYLSRWWDAPFTSEIWVAERSDPSDPFSDATKLSAVVNQTGNPWSPEISDDGLTLLFTSSAPGGFGLEDLWASTRPTKDDDWGEPVNLGPEVNTAMHEASADISLDGSTLYFARSTSSDLYGGYRLWQVAIIPGPLGDMNSDGEVNGLDVDPFVDVLLNGPFQLEADMNVDGVVNGLDVNPFIDAVVRSGTQPVPEPSTLLLALVALGVAAGWRKWGA